MITFFKIRESSNSVGCYPPWFDDNSRICVDETKAKQAILMVNKTTIRKRCPDPCNFLTIHIGGKNVEKLDDNKLARMYYYFAPRIMMRFEISKEVTNNMLDDKTPFHLQQGKILLHFLDTGWYVHKIMTTIVQCSPL